MRFINLGLLAMASSAMAMPKDDQRSKMDAITFVRAEDDPYKPNGTHAWIKVDGVMQTIDLTTPDVIRENGLIRKPLGPNSYLNSSSTGLPDSSQSGDLEKRQEGYCSQYFSCNNEYIYVNGNLWSYWTTRYGSGYALDGRKSGWTTVNAGTSEIRAYGTALAWSYNEVYAGCHIQFDLNGCTIDVPNAAVFASYNCAGCP
ncbi:hypothetical protein FE257_011318 [Aspergillus nanangensis]|uniref:Uncharacterized protein n=1 Tax=Aspergillus nanangensis TaxID=2582783 RepID=A0AAD4CHG3_ASPNN|nr:hypothetical protein FE257_011318 [Aspergillus nanangensis]